MTKRRIGLIIAVVLIALLLVQVRANLAGALLQNLGLVTALHEFNSSGDNCESIEDKASTAYFSEATAYEPVHLATWVNLLRIKGITDREWIRRLWRNPAMSADVRHTLDDAKQALFPASLVVRGSWKERCVWAYAAWTRGLIEAQEGNWTEAVTTYQTGLGLALGRVPDAIVKEYYLALGHELEQSGQAPEQQLAAAKYLVLGGEATSAKDLLQQLTTETRLTPVQHCEVTLGLVWLQDDGTQNQPPWPAQMADNDTCAIASTAQHIPEWAVPPDKALAKTNQGATLLGFDLDRDVLEAGVEVMGILYWQEPDGTVQFERFRKANLWPNSGNNWRPMSATWSCLPGYIEPLWVKPCASGINNDLATSIIRNPVGRLENPQDRLEAFVATSGIPFRQGRWTIFGGLWLSEGNFPRGHVSLTNSNKDDPNSYDVILDLSDLAFRKWQQKTAIVSPFLQDRELAGWIRPVAGTGSGSLFFDDIFCFSLPTENGVP